MVKVISFIFGLFLLLLGLYSILPMIGVDIPYLEVVDPVYLSVGIIIIGILILVIPPAKYAAGRSAKYYESTFFRYIKRWIFGILLILVGLGNDLVYSWFSDLFETIVVSIGLGTLVGGVILLALGLVYLLSASHKIRTTEASM